VAQVPKVPGRIIEILNCVEKSSVIFGGSVGQRCHPRKVIRKKASPSARITILMSRPLKEIFFVEGASN